MPWTKLRLAEEPSARARIADHPLRNQPMPDEEHDHRADGCANQSDALIQPVPAHGLAHERREKRANDAQHRRQYESRRIVGARCQESRDQSGDKANDDDPENVHDAVLVRVRAITPTARPRVRSGCALVASSDPRCAAVAAPIRQEVDHAAFRSVARGHPTCLLRLLSRGRVP